MTTNEKTEEPKHTEYWVYGRYNGMPKEKQNGRDDVVIAVIPEKRLGHLMTGRYTQRVTVHSAVTGDDWIVNPNNIDWLRIERRVLQGGHILS